MWPPAATSTDRTSPGFRQSRIRQELFGVCQSLDPDLGTSWGSQTSELLWTGMVVMHRRVTRVTCQADALPTVNDCHASLRCRGRRTGQRYRSRSGTVREGRTRTRLADDGMHIGA